MPAYRTAKPLSRQQSLRHPLQAQHAPNHGRREVIELSSDDEAPLPTKKTTTLSRKTSRARGKARARQSPATTTTTTDLSEIVEIFSEEESAPRMTQPAIPPSKLAQMQKQLEQLQRENEELKAEVAFNTAANSLHPKEPREVDKKKLAKLDECSKTMQDFEDTMSCEVCIGFMWSPYVLPCGHSFCKNCLTEWFSTALLAHMRTHPDYTPHPPALQQYLQYFRRPLAPPQRAAAERELRSLYAAMQRPEFSCPKCRAAVRSAPSSCFALKHMAEAVGKWTTGQKPTPADTVVQNGAWDGFFPQIPDLPAP